MITGFSESPCEMGDSQGAQYLLNHPVQPLPHPVNHPVPLIGPTNNTTYIACREIRFAKAPTMEKHVVFFFEMWSAPRVQIISIYRFIPRIGDGWYSMSATRVRKACFPKLFQ